MQFVHEHPVSKKHCSQLVVLLMFDLSPTKDEHNTDKYVDMFKTLNKLIMFTTDFGLIKKKSAKKYLALNIVKKNIWCALPNVLWKIMLKITLLVYGAEAWGVDDVDAIAR